MVHDDVYSAASDGILDTLMVWNYELIYIWDHFLILLL